jgi:hypothetical protein
VREHRLHTIVRDWRKSGLSVTSEAALAPYTWAGWIASPASREKPATRLQQPFGLPGAVVGLTPITSPFAGLILSPCFGESIHSPSILCCAVYKGRFVLLDIARSNLLARLHDARFGDGLGESAIAAIALRCMRPESIHRARRLLPRIDAIVGFWPL